MISRAVERGNKCLILTHRSELLGQAGGALKNYGIEPTDIKPGKSIKDICEIPLAVGMAQTIKRRLKKPEYIEWLKNLDLVVIDEAHTQDAQIILTYFGEKTIVIGATATPHREGNQISLDQFYQAIVEVTTIPELVADGFLAKPNTFGVDVDLSGIGTKAGDYDMEQMGTAYNERELYHGVYDNYQKITPGKKTIIFAPNISASKRLVDDFKAKGLPIEHIDGTTPSSERKSILKWFKDTPGALISNVGILNAGFDEPTIEVVILYRATKSLPLFLQMCGRGSRISEGKKSFTILDFGNNVKRHGFWESQQEWTLKKKKNKKGTAPVKNCMKCSALIPAQAKECEYCGFIFPPSKADKEPITVQLRKLNAVTVEYQQKVERFKNLERLQISRGYKKAWVFWQLKNEKELRYYAQWKNFTERWVQYQIRLRNNWL